jgi:DNA repair protein RecN (Recombination protein N)
MLKRLCVENYALIDKLEIGWDSGFTIITGETGAGKSILLGALSLILGQRADAQVLADQSRKCIVEGEFDIHGYGLEDFFTAHDLDADDQLLLRREINVQGKSRAFINDTPVTVNILKDLAVLLIDIHSQHQSLDLNHASFQIQVIDSYGKLQSTQSAYSATYLQLRDSVKRLERLKEEEIRQKKDHDYYRFLFDELEAARIRENELQELETELSRLTHADSIREALGKSTELINESEENIILRLNQVQQFLSQSAKHDESLNDLSARIQSLLIELKEIAYDLEGKLDKIVVDPERIVVLSERIDLLYRLMQKHHVQNERELLEIKNQIDSNLLQISTTEADVKKLEEEIAKLRQEAEKQALQLSTGRKKCIPAAEKKLLVYLKNLGMPDARISIKCDATEDLTPTGKDRICFLFSANKGGEMQELGHVASGGEISRLMLAVKSLISQNNLLPTIIFDEIDSGISGETAGKVGEILSELSQQMQVIAITHLPQIAARGDHHLMVYKRSDQQKTRTLLKTLSMEERVAEIAQMIGGTNVSEVTRETARELLKAGRQVPISKS